MAQYTYISLLITEIKLVFSLSYYDKILLQDPK
jgi:hypothetical protein